MSVLSEFFKGSAAQLGILAPRNYLVALFPDYSTALNTERILLDAGFPENEVVAAPGEDVIRMVKEQARQSGLATLLIQQLSRLLETEEVYVDHDFTLASRGPGFLAVYAPSELKKRRAWKLIEPALPIVARHYSLGGVEHLRGET